MFPATSGHHAHNATPAVVTAAHTDAVRCEHCGQRTDAYRQSNRWCTDCGIWLISCPLSGEWVSFAEREHRERTFRNNRIIASTKIQAVAAQPLVQAAMPTGWDATVEQLIDGASFTIRIQPSTAKTVANLHPPAHDGDDQLHEGWRVRIFDGRTDWAIHAPGGSAAIFANAHDATDAALNQLHMSLSAARDGH